MAGITPIVNRTSTLLTSQQQLARLQSTQRQLFEAEEQIATGKSINRPSDSPEKVATVQYLSQRLQEREQEQRNLDASQNVLNTADQALGEANNILLEAKTIASSQIGVGSDTETREAEALVIDAQLEALIDIANTQFSNISVFGGNNGAIANGQVFESFLGGVRYLGSDVNLATDIGASTDQAFTSNGVAAFGALSSRVASQVDLDPALNNNARLSDLGGALNQGVRKGAVELTVNATIVSVDLKQADTVDDVLTRVNNAITAVSPGAGALSLGADGFVLTGNGGNTVALNDFGNATTARDLGFDGLSSTGGVGAVGDDVALKVTPLTALGDLGVAIDFASGISITQGEQTAVADFSTATTVQDLQNVVRNLGLGVRLQINAAGDGLDFVSEVAGLELSIGENGGTTATDLGVRSLDLTTDLIDFRQGIGVITQEGEDDLEVSLHDGTTFTVNLDGAVTLGDAVGLIQTAATTAGVAPVDFTIGMATVGNGLVFTDNTVGASDFSINDAGQSRAASHLGIVSNSGAAATLISEDNAKVRVENAFTHLIDLRDSLANDDESGITLAGSHLEEDIDAAVSARATVGVQAKRVSDTRLRAEDQTIQEQSMLSNLQDADLTEVISNYQLLQTQLQASLQLTAQSLQLSLLDFLR